MIRTKSIQLTLTSEEPNEESLEAIRETEEIIANHKPGEGVQDGASSDALGIWRAN